MSDITPIPYFPENLNDYAPWVAKHGLVAPYGECQCGCGRKTSVAPHDYKRYGHRKGHPFRFVSGHINGAKQTLEEAFWLNVSPGNPGECWEWQGQRSARGYGRFKHKNKIIFHSHRVSYELHTGPISDGLWVLHKCDNPPCVNPNHLFLGTHQDNMDDMIAKGRKAILQGESHPRAKLTNPDIIEIRSLDASGLSYPEIGKRYGVSGHQIGLIVRGLSWSHVK